VFRVIAVLYTAAALFAAGVATMARDGEPLTHPSPWVVLDGRVSVALSLALGAALVAVVVGSSRLFVRKFEWAKKLSTELRPFSRSLAPYQMAFLALLSSATEELFFRALLAPTLGVVLSSVLFGLVHQVRGPSRWYWAGWAGAVGLALGGIFALTGSLWGPLLAHAAINGINLAFLRDSDPDGARKPLGGLLRTGAATKPLGGLLRPRRSSPDLGART
jgi:uncharacterized protein